MTSHVLKLQIERLGQRGEGIASGAAGPIYIPYALEGETILAEIVGERGRLIEILEPSPERITAFCPHYSICGGCAVQALAASAYAEWKRGLVVSALRHANVTAEVGELVDAHGDGRRRATFHARFGSKGEAEVGFMKARAHEIVTLESCPILAPQMAGALPAAWAIAETLQAGRKPLDILVTATLSGLDVDVKGYGPLPSARADQLMLVAKAQDLARLSNHAVLVIERRAPILRMGKTEVSPPPGAFLQATEAGEAALAETVLAALSASRRALDLFAGVGTFSLRLAASTQVHAVDSDAAALAALARAARSRSGLRPVTVEARDLFRRPFAAAELAAYDAVIFDPPRAGAEAQARALAASAVALVAAVSCSPASFARDTALLVAGGYEIESITPFDQFRHSPHVEIVGILRRPEKKLHRNRRLLG
ncbi:class I SAM-dependent RNA methyltransferase [Methylovirgula sp. HY1]|uniref:class I SAM-dependent RNA methyltransferase n=1 Tax=Methylovirgula sp. HY1 TaxID=2822761 RepID=UPI001C5B0E07|nr:methyltransferase [Methylovirgula sp. HY1]QXX73418.1 23S rRNA (uracil(1939)-C(5))-methyltransferase RlmD [Methylovirgula sp. HY1]